MTLTLYHGTRAAYVDDIKAHGLLPCAKPGNDASWQSAGKWRSPARQHSVFMSPNRDTAAMFAGRLANETHDKPVIVEIHLPDSERGRLHFDEATTTGHDSDLMRFEGEIKPEWIADTSSLTDGELFMAAMMSLLAA